ncbi:ribonuclease D [Aquimonas voraii]|uniref:Ribonuclease D n=1 Tax=Aquimonas voraii TaxID=265719 RepID=A0A1G6SZ27_9GAMM|nr:ribonuclease D [Aquimonas voraii]SDD22058.1 ribonuclease D [Aquimonas voraii]
MQWIDTPADASRLSAWTRDSGPIAMDTEFMREKTFYPELALVQLGRPGEVLLLDAPRLGRLPEMRALLDAPTLKVMHSASEDLQALHHAYGCLPAPLFDTQIAAGLAGLDPSLSYQKLVAELCGVTLEKGETRSDWLRRPLSESQLHYAADDVRYLLQPFEELSRRLEALGRSEWLREDCERSLQQAVEVDDPLPHLAVRPAQGLPRAAQARLRRLLLWRDRQARVGNRPRSWMLDTGLAVDIAQRAPLDRSAFEQLLDRNPKSPRRRRDELFDLANAEPTAEELDIPLAELPEPSERDFLRKLQQAVATVAAELKIADSMLASRRHLETLLREGRWSKHLSGWRRGVLEARLAPLLPPEQARRAQA